MARNESVCYGSTRAGLAGIVFVVMCRAGSEKEGSHSRTRHAEQAELVLCFRGGHVHGELALPTRSESFGIDSSSAMVVFTITEVIRHG